MKSTFICFCIFSKLKMCLSHGQVMWKVYLSELYFYLSWTIGHRFWRTLILSWNLRLLHFCIKIFITFCINIITFYVSITFWGVTGLISGPSVFGGFAGRQRDFLGLIWFFPIIQSSLSIEIQSTPPGCILSYIHCHISAEIRIVYSQSDLRIL